MGQISFEKIFPFHVRLKTQIAMNSDTVNVVYSFSSNTVLECEYKINALIGKSDRTISPIYPSSYECYLKYGVNNNEKSICCVQNYKEELFHHVEEKDTSYTVGPINTKRLGISWRKQTNMNKRKRQLLKNEQIKNEINNSTSCQTSDQQRLLAPRIPFTYYHCHQQQEQCCNCNISKSNFRSITSAKETSLTHINNISDSECVTTVEKENTHNFVVNVAVDDNTNEQEFLCAKREKRWRRHKHRTRSYSSILNYVRLIMSCSYLLLQNCKSLNVLFVLLLTSTQYLDPIEGLLVSKSSPSIGIELGSIDFKNASDILVYNSTKNNSSINKRLTKSSYNLELEGGDRGDIYLSASKNLIVSSSTEGGISGGAYLDKLDNLERSLAEVLIKVAYGTTSTTKRSIPENSYVPSLTTIATPLLTTLRYQEKAHQSQLNMHHRNYELDLERDHALPTSAPNADILKSNSNPTYPNPNRHHNHERDRHRHLINSTPKPSLPNILKKTNGQMPTISMFPVDGELPSYSPPARSFFTPPLPPEYQHPFADKPTLRGTNNEGGIELNTGSYINRRPIPPPSLMPGHERIPFRPPDLGGSPNINEGGASGIMPSLSDSTASPVFSLTTTSAHHEMDVKKALNTPSKAGINSDISNVDRINTSSSGMNSDANNNLYNNSNNPEVRKEVLPSIRRILSGSNGRKGDIPEVLLQQVTTRPNSNYHHAPSSPVVLIDSSLLATNEGSVENADNKQNINKIKNMMDSDIANGEEKTKITTKSFGESNFVLNNITSTPSAAAAIGGSEKVKGAISAAGATSTTSSNLDLSPSTGKNNGDGASSSTSSSTSSISSSTSSSTLASASAHATWSLAWNIHVYLSVILFTILAVYSFYKMITYNKLTHLFSQSYFICIHLILIIICTARTFYLCYDAYNIHSSFHVFISEILLNLPSTFLTISFAVLILFLSLKSLNHKNNRYSALIRPLTVVVGCGVHVVLCITLHYVESYTLQNHQQQLYYQQQQQLLTKRQHMHQQQQQHHQNLQYNYLQNQYSYAANIIGMETMAFSSSVSSVQGAHFHQNNIATSVSSLPPPPPRVLSLICQIIYIFVCFSLGLLYLYLYRILKRILRSKSQNYIHGYQNLSYAIHITIATALLFVLLASLQIFGAISISSSRPLIMQKTSEIDWLQWGYQFSLRLIEIAIITLISWVTGLKTSNGTNTVNINLTNNEARVVAAQVNVGNSMFNTNLSINPVREKHSVHSNQYNHSNMTNFFLPCTSSSSQEQFDTDYPAVCNANTNLHTYTMRTGKLIYDDSFALNSLNGNNTAAPPNDFHHSHHQVQQLSKQQMPQSTYQHPYDSQSLHSSAHHNVSEYGSRINYQPENHLQYNDYLTDNTTDHYENPNFDLRGSATSGSALVVNSNTGNGTMQKFGKTSISNSTTTPSSSNNSNMGSNSSSGSSATLQQQMLLLHGGGETCYSEPIHENYDFNNFEKPKFKQQPHDNWPDAHIPTILNKRDKKKSLTTLERCGYDKPERRSSNSTHSCNSNSNSTNNGVSGNGSGSCGGSSRYASFNTFERAPFNNVRKSDTFNNITTTGVNVMHGRNNSSSSAASATSASGPKNTSLAIQTLASTERHHHGMPSRNLRVNGSSKILANNTSGLDVFSRSTIERSSIISHTQQRPLNQAHISQPQAQHQYSDDDEDDKDDDKMLTVSPQQV